MRTSSRRFTRCQLSRSKGTTNKTPEVNIQQSDPSDELFSNISVVYYKLFEEKELQISRHTII